MNGWKRLPRTWAEIFAHALGRPDPLAGFGIPHPIEKYGIEAALAERKAARPARRSAALRGREKQA